jgi:predicted small lipoprotein YifL
MRAIATAILLCVLLQACGSKGALVLPPENGGAQKSNSNKQK